MEEKKGFTDEQVTAIKVIGSLTIIILISSAIFMVWNYQNILKTAPCDYIEENSGWVCTPNPEYYINCVEDTEKDVWNCMRKGGILGVSYQELEDKKKLLYEREEGN